MKVFGLLVTEIASYSLDGDQFSVRYGGPGGATFHKIHELERTLREDGCPIVGIGEDEIGEEAEIYILDGQGGERTIRTVEEANEFFIN